MADPRLDAKHAGVGAVYDTFKIDNSTITFDATKEGGSTQVGLAVTLSADNTIALVDTDQKVLGKLVKVASDNVASVQVAGGMTLAAGSAVSVGFRRPIIGAQNTGAKGYIKQVSDAATPTAAEVNAVMNGRGIILDGSVTTAVQVML